MAGSISIAEPKYIPNWTLETGKLVEVSQNLTQSYQAYSAIVEMYAGSPFALFPGT
jgi:hypothetical protein